MSALNKFVSYEKLERFWQRIRERYDRKLDSVTNRDETITVSSGREISVRISSNKNNLLSIDKDKGLFVPKNKKLIFGDYEYDGSEEVIVTVYDGEYNMN